LPCNERVETFVVFILSYFRLSNMRQISCHFRDPLFAALYYRIIIFILGICSPAAHFLWLQINVTIFACKLLLSLQIFLFGDWIHIQVQAHLFKLLIISFLFVDNKFSSFFFTKHLLSYDSILYSIDISLK